MSVFETSLGAVNGAVALSTGFAPSAGVAPFGVADSAEAGRATLEITAARASVTGPARRDAADDRCCPEGPAMAA